MFSGLATKIALKKVGLSSNALDFPQDDSRAKDAPVDDSPSGGWLSYKSLPLTVHPWFSPPPPPVKLGRIPQPGDRAPLDRDRQLIVGGGQRMLVVFLRCVGCAFAQKTFLALRTLSNRYRGQVACVAVSHSSEQATRKWIDLLGGAWNVHVIFDEERAIYAAWGLGTANVWHLFNPTTQVQGWKEKGWLGEKVAEAMQRRGTVQARGRAASAPAAGPLAGEDEESSSTVLGNKWQESGAFAVDGRAIVVWGGKAARADEMMDLEEGIRMLGV